MMGGEGMADMEITGVEGLRAVKGLVGLEGVRCKGVEEGEG